METRERSGKLSRIVCSVTAICGAQTYPAVVGTGNFGCVCSLSSTIYPGSIAHRKGTPLMERHPDDDRGFGEGEPGGSACGRAA